MTSRRSRPDSVAFDEMAAPVTVDEFRALEQRVDAHDVRLAVQDANASQVQKTLDAVVSELVKTRWTLIAFAFTVAGSTVGAVVGFS